MRTGRPNCILPPHRLIALAITVVAGNASAAEWEGNASIAPSIAYTDNVCLTKDNKKNDWTGVGILTPSGSVSHKTRKSSFSVSGSLQINTLTNGDLRDNGCSGTELEDNQKIFPSIFAKGSTVVIDDWVTLDVTGRADQNEITSALPTPSDNINRNLNTNTYYRYSISPTLSHRLKNKAKYSIKYSYDDVINTADSVSDSTRHQLRTTLSNGNSSRVTWNLQGKYTKVSYSDGLYNRFTGQFQPREDTELRSVRINLGYQLDRRWQVNGSAGKEFNDIQTFNNSNTDGNIWEVGVRWTPSRRTSVSVGTGNRFFGSTPYLNIVHEYKRNTFTAAYNKTITFQRDITTGGNNLIEGIDANSSINSNGAILDERGTLGYIYNGRNALINLNGSYSEQTRADDGAQGVFKTLSLTFTPLLSQNYTLSGTIAYDEDEPVGFIGLPNVQDFAESKSWIYSIQFGKPINNRLSMSLNYQFTDQQSDNSLNEYQENRVIATLNITL